MAVTKLHGNGREHGYTTCTIISGATESTAADIEGFCNVGLLIPTIESAALTFQVSNLVDGTYYTLVDGNRDTITLASGTGAVAIQSSFVGRNEAWRYAKVIASTVQTSDRIITFVVKA